MIKSVFIERELDRTNCDISQSDCPQCKLGAYI